jgi:hypothetical protein
MGKKGKGGEGEGHVKGYNTRGEEKQILILNLNKSDKNNQLKKNLLTLCSFEVSMVFDVRLNLAVFGQPLKKTNIFNQQILLYQNQSVR